MAPVIAVIWLWKIENMHYIVCFTQVSFTWGDEQKNETQVVSFYYGVSSQAILHFCCSVLICKKVIKNLFALNKYYRGVISVHFFEHLKNNMWMVSAAFSLVFKSVSHSPFTSPL